MGGPAERVAFLEEEGDAGSELAVGLYLTVLSWDGGWMVYLEVKRKQPSTARLSSIVRVGGGDGSSSGCVWSIVSSDGLSPPGA